MLHLRSRRSIIGLTVAAIVAITALSTYTTTDPADAANKWSGAVRESDNPDPDIVNGGDGYFYMYSTNFNYFGWYHLPTLRSKNLKDWEFIGNSLPELGSWAREGYTWAPGVEKFGNTWNVYYTARHRASNRQCIGVASSASPAGPFTDTRSAPIVCQTSLGGSIDADTVRDATGTTWLLWKSDENALDGNGGRLWSQKLSANGTNVEGHATVLLGYDRSWENPLIEQPAMIQSGSKWILTYSGNWWESSNYAIGWAVCDSPQGPCTKKSTSGPLHNHASTGIPGVGAAAFFEDDSGQTFMVTHGWINGVGYGNGGARAPFIEPVTVSTTSGVQPLLTHSGTVNSEAPSGQPVAGDFNGDGFSDVFWYGKDALPDEIWWGTRNRDFTRTSTAVHGTYAPIAGDFDGDGRDDIFWYAPGPARDTIWYGNADSTFSHASIRNVSGTYKPVAGDFDGDAATDILWYAPGTAPDSYWYFTKGRRGSYTSEATSVRGTYQAFAGDFDGDGRDDIYFYAPGRAPDSIWYMHQTRNRHTSVQKNVHGSYRPAAGDFDGDGTTDILWYAPGAAGDSFWYGTRSRTFRGGDRVSISGTYTPVTGDFDDNKQTDILWMDTTAARSPIWWGRAGGHDDGRVPH